jgi:Zinc finger, C2H2 type
MKTCEKCGKDFRDNQNLQRHLQSKKPCTELIAKKMFSCSYCSKNFTRKSNCVHHEKYKCLENFDRLIEEDEEKEKGDESQQVVNVSSSIQTQNITNNNIQTQNITNNNIQNNIDKQIYIEKPTFIIHNYGKENTDYITDDAMIELFKEERMRHAIQQLFVDTHCNINHPENMNIQIANINKKIFKIKYDGKWSIFDFDKSIMELILDKNSNIQTFYHKFEAVMDQYMKTNYRNLQLNMENNADFKEYVKTYIISDLMAKKHFMEFAQKFDQNNLTKEYEQLIMKKMNLTIEKVKEI